MDQGDERGENHNAGKIANLSYRRNVGFLEGMKALQEYNQTSRIAAIDARSQLGDNPDRSQSKVRKQESMADPPAEVSPAIDLIEATPMIERDAKCDRQAGFEKLVVHINPLPLG